ncbi:carcinine hydrolase/isopenicillin-N N-acyltransferase family protein [Bradyrhizobium sp. McL0615]|uniref:carcinine hydrolase/isopenicillin-N N-acyltransferase family protein n=1 Tax=Bradyrhizobium sp. McL0615 TaxID=3415673 RepID=UPI003CE701E9
MGIVDMFAKSALSLARLLMRSPAISSGVDRLGVRRWYERYSVMRNQAEPAVSADALYDARRGLWMLHGTWRAIGAELARVTPVAREVGLASDYRSSLPQAERKCVDAGIDETFEHLRARHADVAAYLEGASDGLSGAALRDVVLAASWPSLVQWRDYSRSCAALAVQTRNGTILGQNLDVGPSNNVVVAHVRPDDGPARLCHLMPGYFWLGMGVNEFGVTFGGGSVNVARNFQPSPASLSTSFSDMAVLGVAHSVAEAERAFRSFAPLGPTHDGISLVIADRLGAVSRLEATGPDVCVRAGQAAEFAANHFELEGMTGLNRNDDTSHQLLLDNSAARLARARQQFVGPAQADARKICRFLRAGRGPGAWRRTAIHPDTGWTTASYVVDLGQAQYHYWLGTRPVGVQWRQLDLEPLFSGRSYV